MGKRRGRKGCYLLLHTLISEERFAVDTVLLYCQMGRGYLAPSEKRIGEVRERQQYYPATKGEAAMTERFILLVEDNPDDVELTLRALKKNNIINEVVVAKDGAEALDYLFGTGAHAGRDTGVLPEVVLLDLKLPKVGGLDVLKRIRADERTKPLPVIVLTSSREEKDVMRAYNLGTNSYIRKPVDWEQFVDAVRQLGMYWLVLNVSPFKRD